MFKNDTFTVTKEHLLLINRLHFNNREEHYLIEELKQITVGEKRPFGNSDIMYDIAEILGELPYDEENFDRYVDLFNDLKTVLEIGVRYGKFELGDYEKERYSSDWKKVGEGQMNYITQQLFELE